MAGVSVAGLDQIDQAFEVGVVLLRGLHDEPLTHERRQRDGSQLAPESACPASAVLTADDDERPAPGEGAAEP